MERMTFEFTFEEWVGHRCIHAQVYISISHFGVGKLISS